MSDDLDVYVRDLEANEGIPGDEHGCYAYLDSRGLCTFGIGCMVPNVASFLTHPWFDLRGVPPVPSYAYEDLMFEGQTAPPRAAEHYQRKTTLRLSVDYCRQLCRDRLEHEFLPHIVAACDVPNKQSAWFGLPLDARRVLVDCAWTTGAAGFAHEWPKLIAACKAGDWDAAAGQCTSSGMGEGRKSWRLALFAGLR
jgi:GH24 family phage-related lysozyme (muramidase)